MNKSTCLGTAKTPSELLRIRCLAFSQPFVRARAAFRGERPAKEQLDSCCEPKAPKAVEDLGRRLPAGGASPGASNPCETENGGAATGLSQEQAATCNRPQAGADAPWWRCCWPVACWGYGERKEDSHLPRPHHLFSGLKKL